MKKIPHLKINIRNESDETAIIDIDGEIGWINENGEWNTASRIKNKLKEIDKLEASKIIVNINSLGGFVDDGLAIHDVLASHSAEIETRVIGMTASAATIVAQAGDKRFMSDNSLYLIHKAWGLAIGNVNDMMAVAEDLEAIDKRVLNIYAKRSGKSEAELEELMNENTGGGKWIDADEALEFGLIDESFEPMKAAAAVVNNDLLSMMGVGLPKTAKNGISVIYRNGEQLGNLLDRAIDQAVEDGDYENRTEAKQAAADEAGIAVNTLNNILSGDINCPPRERLEGFARALPVSVDEQISAAENDGCEYDNAGNLIGCRYKDNDSDESGKEVPEGISLEEARIKEIETLI